MVVGMQTSSEEVLGSTQKPTKCPLTPLNLPQEGNKTLLAAAQAAYAIALVFKQKPIPTSVLRIGEHSTTLARANSL